VRATELPRENKLRERERERARESDDLNLPDRQLTPTDEAFVIPADCIHRFPAGLHSTETADEQCAAKVRFNIKELCRRVDGVYRFSRPFLYQIQMVALW